MSGHNRWSKIKHKKEATSSKKSKKSKLVDVLEEHDDGQDLYSNLHIDEASLPGGA